LGGNGIATFVKFVKIKKSFDGLSLKAKFFDARLEHGAAVIAPPAFHEKRIPSEAFFVRARATRRKGPSENLFIRAASERARLQGSVRHAQEITAAEVKAFAEVANVIRRQLADGLQANFVQHAAKINQAASF
jgi:hypothetical protein